LQRRRGARLRAASTAGDPDVQEDVGRHNARGRHRRLMWLDDIDGSDKVFYTTGRLT
jgi:formate dehydrogenase assembly factor FdhD